MDIVTDIAAEAVSYLTVFQDICKYNLTPEQKIQAEKSHLWDVINPQVTTHNLPENYKIRIGEILWSSKGTNAEDELIKSFFEVALSLLKWLEKTMPAPDSNSEDEKANLFSSPFFWRQQIRDILYHYPQERKELAVILKYMPLQIIMALLSKPISLYKQRLYQIYSCKSNPLLTAKDQEDLDKWWNGPDDKITRRVSAIQLLTHDKTLLSRLNQHEISVPFETFFTQELEEIGKSRLKRHYTQKHDLPFKIPQIPLNNHGLPNDPFRRADKMALAGLAFSGGGIRSATFNLGLLQKLAELGLLTRFDYLSTVSGGGYIGSWYTSWIKRTGSVHKVNDRLNVKKSADPMAEEVRPLRWLRMFSNYLTPTASIMSADSWTMGITWLRNTVINQVILLLLLLTVLSGIDFLYRFWLEITPGTIAFDFEKVLLWSAVILLPGAALAGNGMRAYNDAHPPQSKFNLRISSWTAQLMVAWGIIAAFVTSVWLYTASAYSYSYAQKFSLLLPCIFTSFFAMIFVALIGRYHHSSHRKSKIKLYFAIPISSIIASIAGISLLAGVWQLIEYFPVKSTGTFQHKLILILGVPLLLETISIAVVIRMVLMGSLFPDERREWWGKMGAQLHRFILMWILATTCALIVKDIFHKYLHILIDNLSVIFGSWAAIIGFAVRMAYQSKLTGDKKVKGPLNLIEYFIRFAPYLFMLGFLLIGAYLMDYLRILFSKIELFGNKGLTQSILMTLSLITATAILSWRVGANEFSLHHFYRNRLVRAYLGATRRRTDREKTSNSFTGFDKGDDLKLATFLSGQDYDGPYPLINTSLNATVVSALDRQDRKAESFLFSPLYCGFDFSPTRSAAYARNKIYEYGYRPTALFSEEKGPLLGTAMAISGAAVSPNMGYHSSAATAFLLTMFNVRLGWWIGNPRLKCWKRADPRTGIAYLVKDLIGKSDINTNYVCLSDGGHFDNMGLYELIRRRCTFILLGDAEEDINSSCEGLANAIRRCRIDFGAEITIDLSDITSKDENTDFSKSHLVKGTIKYPDSKTPAGTIIYIKTTMTGKETADVREYAIANPEFPQQSTGDQFFNEAQFESYRKLGYDSI